MNTRSITTGNRFWFKVKIGAKDACWPWTRSRNNKNYGKCSWGHSTWRLAHRVAFFTIHGRWPKSKLLHSCDNPPCCNPAHLFEGTQKNNIRDASRKGRLKSPHPTAAGEGNHEAKLTWREVDEIRYIRANMGLSLSTLAAAYRVSKRTIIDIIHNETWKR